jgi:hypothetical protein
LLPKIKKKDKKQKWLEQKDKPAAAYEPWTEDVEKDYEELEKTQLTIEDTELGRACQAERKKLYDALDGMNDEERQHLFEK